MHNKEALGFLIERTALILRGIGKARWIPVLMIYLIIPAMNIIVAVGDGNIRDSIISNCMLFYPALSVFWLILYFKEYIEGMGSELLYVKNRIKIGEVIMLYILYMICIAVSLIVYGFFISDVILLLTLKIIIVSYFFYGLTYALVYITKSIILSCIPVIIFSLNSIAPLFKEFESFNYGGLIIEKEDFLNNNFIFIFWGTIFTLLAVYVNKQYTSNT